MDRESARRQIREDWRTIISKYTGPAKIRVNGEKSYICPICGHGTHGDGMTVNTRSKDRNGLKCFGCDFSGDIIDLVMQVTGMDYTETLAHLADMIGITIDPYRPEVTGTASTYKAKPAVSPPAPEKQAQIDPEAGHGQNSDDAAKTKHTEPDTATDDADEVHDYTPYYKECRERLSDPDVIAYLTGRGISIETAKAYWLGYDPDWKNPTAIRRGKNPPASPRLIIPTSTGHYIARDIRKNLTETQERFSKMNEGRPAIFNNRALYAHDVQDVFVTEGAMDALSVMEAGAPAIALNSTSNVNALLDALNEKRTSATLILCLDNDKKGKMATETLRSGLDLLNISHISVDICGGCKDPNEALTKDRMTFFASVEKAQKQARTKPDGVATYIQTLMGSDIERFRSDIKTGFMNLDSKIGGMYSGLYVVAAISSLGKTTFCHQMADQIAANGNDVLFFSMEQSRLEMVSKSLARRVAQMDMNNTVTSLAIRKGYLPEVVKTAVSEYIQTVENRLSVIEGNFSCDISFIGEYIRQYMRKNKVNETGNRPVVIIDYLQILQPGTDEIGRRQTTKEIVDTTITELKRLSRELDLTIIAISSINRANYLQSIDFESLKESGNIEYTADVIWGLQLQCLNDPQFESKDLKEKRDIIKNAKHDSPRKIELVSLKNRYGIATFSCYFDYYPASDLFTVCDESSLDFVQPVKSKKAGRKL